MSTETGQAKAEGVEALREAMPFGALLEKGKAVHFALFAPGCAEVRLELEGLPNLLRMNPEGEGWHRLSTPAASAGSRYRFVLPDGKRVPDPASRYQPEDVHGPSQVMDPGGFQWTDGAWRGRPWTEAILYELHVGTFTKEGTFRAATEKLDHLAALGITGIELMCVADFAGNRSWGYDGVLLYAPDSAYGTPDDAKRFIQEAHARGMMVLLDVVFNHFGPEGNFLPAYFPEIGSERHQTPWGNGLNFDGKRCAEVRRLLVQNALYWIEEFHADGLRLDASHAMVDDSPRHILDELRDEIAAHAGGREIHLILENEQNIEGRLQRDSAGRTLGYTAQWNHDITHLLSAVFSDLGTPGREEDTGKLGKALAEGFVIAAQSRDGASCCSAPPTAFVAFIQTHDLVGNRIFGDRIFANADRSSIRAIASVYLLLPQIPMLFMGEEWGASTPFPFFCDYHGELADAIRQGRCAQLAKLDPAPTAEEMQRAPDPQAESTLRSAQLDWEESTEAGHAEWLEFYKGLIRVRTEAVVPLLAGLTGSCGSSETIGPGALAIGWTLREGRVLRLAANLTGNVRAGFPKVVGRTIWMEGTSAGEEELGPWSVRWTVEGE